MKIPGLIIALALVAACTPQTEPPATDIETAAGPTQVQADVTAAPASDMAPASPTASATGVVEAVDAAAGTITIAHGPVDAFQWPPMTMTFPAPGLDLGSIKAGDHVILELTQTGSMEATVTSITPDQPVR